MGQKAPTWQWDGDATGLNASITQDAAAPSNVDGGIAKVASGAGVDGAVSSIGSTNLLEDSTAGGGAIQWRIDNFYSPSGNDMFSADFSIFWITPDGLADGDWEPVSLILDNQTKFPLDVVMRQGVTDRVDVNVGEAEYVFSKDPLQFTYTPGEEDGLQVLITWSVSTNTLSLYKNGVLADSATLVSVGPSEFLIESMLCGFSSAGKAIADLIRLYDYVPADTDKIVTAIDDYHSDTLESVTVSSDIEDQLNEWELFAPALAIISTLTEPFDFGTALADAASSGQILTNKQINDLNNWRSSSPAIDAVNRNNPFNLGDILNEAMGNPPFTTVLTQKEISSLNLWSNLDPGLARIGTLTNPFRMGDYLNELLTRS